MFCTTCNFVHNNFYGSGRICAKTRDERLRNYYKFLSENLSPDRSSLSLNLSVEWERVSPYALDPNLPSSILQINCACCTTHLSWFKCSFYLKKGFDVVYYMCKPCRKRGEKLLFPSCLTLSETRRLLLLCLRVTYPRFYRIKDMRRYLSEWIA